MGGLGPPLFGDLQASGWVNAGPGSMAKSRQMHMRWQQSGPTVVGQPHPKPLLHCGPFVGFLPPSLGEQSSSELQGAAISRHEQLPPTQRRRAQQSASLVQVPLLA